MLQQVYVYGREKDLAPFLISRIEVKPTSLDSQGFLSFEARIKMIRTLLAYPEAEDVTTVQLLYAAPETEKIHEERWTRSIPMFGDLTSVEAEDGSRFYLEYERKTVVRHFAV